MYASIRFTQPTGHGVPPLPHKGPGEPEADNEGLALPVNPDQGTPLMPDEQGEIQAPA